MVTGATGYIAGWLIEDLLELGCQVHATVRDLTKKERLKDLYKVAEKTTGKLVIFEADLLNPGSFAEAMAGCEVVFHTASPFSFHVANPKEELITPALEGTRNVLNQANVTDTVKKVVLTSSVSAIYSDLIDLNSTQNGEFTEADWNQTSSEDYQPYPYSKTLAEKEAWQIASQQSRWSMVAINPSFVIGPSIHKSVSSESFKLIQQLLNGEFRFGAPSFGLGVVDVRDVAYAHVCAGFMRGVEGRYIVSAENTSLLQLANILRHYPEYAKGLPKKALPKWLLWLVGPFVNPALTRSYISKNINLDINLNNTKARGDFGLSYRPVEDSILDMAHQIYKQSG